MASQRRPNVLVFPTSKLPSGKFTMLRCNLSKSLPLGRKAEQLQRTRPDVAAVIERLVDDLLLEVS